MKTSFFQCVRGGTAVAAGREGVTLAQVSPNPAPPAGKGRWPGFAIPAFAVKQYDLRPRHQSRRNKIGTLKAKTALLGFANRLKADKLG
jgi:hypothetical protein